MRRAKRRSGSVSVPRRSPHAPVGGNFARAVLDTGFQQFLTESECDLMAVAVADRQIDINQTAGRESAGEDRFFHENGFLAGSCRLDCGGNARDTAADNGNIIIDFEIHKLFLFYAGNVVPGEVGSVLLFFRLSRCGRIALSSEGSPLPCAQPVHPDCLL